MSFEQFHPVKLLLMKKIIFLVTSFLILSRVTPIVKRFLLGYKHDNQLQKAPSYVDVGG